MKHASIHAVVAAFLLPLAALAAETVVVVAKGTGGTVKSAERAAFRAAVEKVVGTLVDAETLVANDEIVEDSILAYSNGFVETFETVKGPSKHADGLYSVTIRATVRKGQLAEKVTAAFKTETEVDGGGLFAELLTRRDAMQDAQAMIEKLLEGIPADLLVAEVATGPDGKAKVALDARTGNVTVDVTVRIDPEAYIAWTSKLTALLDKVATSKSSIYRMFYGSGSTKILVVVPRRLSDYNFEPFQAWDAYNTGWDKTNDRKFKFTEYEFSEDTAPLIKPLFENGEILFRVSVLDSSGHTLAEHTDAAFRMYYGSIKDIVPFVRTPRGIVPGWSCWRGNMVAPSTTMTIDLGAFTPEDLRAASRFECTILGRTETISASPPERCETDSRERTGQTDNPNLDFEKNPLPDSDDGYF